MALIELKNLEKIYENDGVKTPALQGVSFSIEKGEFTAIMGPSGSGKSTLLHILGFLDRPTSGVYKFNQKTINDYSGEELAGLRNKKMGFVFQMFNLLPRTTVLDNVLLPIVYSGLEEAQWKEKAEKAIREVRMEYRISHETSQLSGGEKQRVAIARALVNNPEVIFADEPTGNLDSKSGEVIMDALQRLNNEGHTIILITHETYTAEHAGRIIRLKDGMMESDEIVKNRRVANGHFFK
jgi:putative ABC transport system ATP-binding protein